MTTRKYLSTSQETTLVSAMNSSQTTMVVNSAAGLLGSITPAAGETFTVVIDPDTSLEEIVDVIAPSNPASNTLTIVRQIDGTAAIAHSAGARVRHMATGRDFREANTHIESTTGVHGVSGSVVGTSGSQTLTGKTISGASNTITNIPNSATTATNTNTPSTIVARDASGNFSAGTITANLTGNVSGSSGSTTGNAATATALQTARDFQILGDVEASAVSFNGTGNVNLTTQIATGVIVNADVNASANIAATKIAGTAVTQADTGTVTSAMIANGTIVDADINAAAAIDKTKISGTAITAADTGTVTSTMIADGAIVNADVNASAQIAYSKLNLANGIVNADINPSAGISLSKLATDPLARANHTGTQAASTISDFDTQVHTSRLDQMAAPTAAVSLNSQKITNLDSPTASSDAANKGYVDTQITNLVDAAPGALDTLNELAAALGDDANFSTTVTNSLATKLSLSGGTMTGAIAMSTNKITGLGDPTNAQDAATKNYIDTVVLAPSNLTGVITSVGNVTSTGAQTGTGSTFVMQDSPTLTTPNLGVATATSINGTTIPSSETLVTTTSTAYIVPSQTGNDGKFLQTNGTTTSWQAAVTLNTANTFTTGTQLIQTGGISNVGLAVQAHIAGGQTANLQEWRDASGNVITKVDNAGGLYVGTGGTFIGSTSGRALFVANGTTFVPIIAKGASGQTAKLQEWQNSAGTTLNAIGTNGEMQGTYFGSLAGSKAYIQTDYDTNAIGVFSGAAANKGLVVRGATSQTADLQQWQNSAGSSVAYVSSVGAVAANYLQGLGATTPYMQFTGNDLILFTRNAAYKGLIIRGATSQTANLQEWQDSSGNNLVRIAPSGTLSANNLVGGGAGNTALGIFTAFTASAYNIGIVVRGASGQTADLTQWQDSAGTRQGYVSAGGNSIVFPGVTSIFQMVASTGVTTVVPLVTRGAASQTANLQQWQNSAATVLAGVAANGAAFFGNTGALNASVAAIPTATTASGIIVRGLASQSANLQEWQDSAGTVLTRIDEIGRLGIGVDPASALQVSGQANIINSVAGTSTVMFLGNNDTTSTSVVKLAFTSSGVTKASINAAVYGNDYLTFNTGSDTERMRISGLGNVLINGFTSSTVGLTVKGAASQSANLQEWQSSAGSVLSRVDSGGGIQGSYLYAGAYTFYSATVNITPNFTTTVGAVIRGLASQTADLQQWQSSAGTVLLSVSSSGRISTNQRTSFGFPIASAVFDAQNNFSNDTDPARVVMLVRGAASQSVNLQVWQDSTSTNLAFVDSIGRGKFASGLFGAISSSIGSNLAVVANNSTTIAAIIRGATSQTANLQEWQNSAGTVLVDITAEGVLDAPLVTNAQTVSYTLVASDAGKLIEINNTAATTLTVPTNASVPYAVGTQINILQTSAGQITVAGAGGVTVNATPGLKLRTQWSSATLIKRATDTWVLVGDLSA